MFVLILLSVCLCASASTQYFAPEQASEYFEEFISKFDKKYTDDNEKALRFEIFKANLKIINRMNKESPHAEFVFEPRRTGQIKSQAKVDPEKSTGITQFADITPEEFSQSYTGLRDYDDQVICPTVLHDGDIVDANAPESFDWRTKGVVTKVKSQGNCGSCYAFSATGNIEGQNAIKHKTLVELSEQQIVDCDKRSAGCHGGLMSKSMISLKELGGSMKESDYPYKANNGTCASDKSKVAVKLGDCISYDLTSQEKVKQLLFKNGPLSIDIFCSLPILSHGVLLVGYGSENDQPYWIVKNSWGEDFGERGYFRLQRSKDVTGACRMLNKFMVTAVVE